MIRNKRYDFVSIVAEKSNNTAKIISTDNFTKPVAEATGYKNITPAGVFGFEQVISWLKKSLGRVTFP
ncbi:hypothetical protein [uncultured Cyclobacterium sp.]|uniref:hypothetical protein n=1 Tax=uncultured Cyclobacterium sp. TaxID=453820 RepID=UPI0030ED07F4